MSKDYDLHHDDYLNIVNDVIHQTTPAGVKTIIEERYEKYSPHNKDFLGTLLDVVDNYDGFSQDYQYIGSSQDILQVFNELVFFDQFPYNHKYPQLIYAACLVFEMCNQKRSVAGEQKEDSTGTNNDEKQKLVTRHQTFQTLLSDKQLEEVYNWLVEKKYINKCTLEQFAYIFQQQPISKAQENKIKWIKTYNGKSDNISLFIFLNTIAPRDFYCNERMVFYRKVIDCFTNYQGENINMSTLKNSFNKWYKNDVDNLSDIIRGEERKELYNFLVDITSQ